MSTKPAASTPRPSTAPAQVTTPSRTPAKADPAALRTLTQQLAYELWEKGGRKHGTDVHNWLEAEKIARVRLGL